MPSEAPETTFSAAQVAAHNKEDDLWVTIDGGVYDLTKFALLHPGGLPPLIEVAGGDATELFYSLHRASTLHEPRYARLRRGRLAGTDIATQAAADAGSSAAAEPTLTPYGEASGFWRKASPYYRDDHHRLRAAVRAFIEREIMPTALDDDEQGHAVSIDLNRKMGAAGILATVVAGRDTGRVLSNLGLETELALPGGVHPTQEYDLFHDLIVSEEFKRTGCYGLTDGLMGGLSIGLPPLVHFGAPALQRRFVPDVLRGERRICLAISEPYAGSDVAQIRTRAVRSADGRSLVVSGVKKWITGGMYADLFTTLVRVVDAGDASDAGQMALLVIERDDNVETRPIKTSYSAAAGTAYVTFDSVVVPIVNVLGEIGQGFKLAMHNFNKERWGMVAGGNRMSRLMVEECFKWALQRKVFGKRLIDQPVIRAKLAEMAAEVECVHSLLEDVTFQMTRMTHAEINRDLAGPIALLKYKQTRVATRVSDQACQIFGGRALTRSGMGALVEKFQRSFKMQAILGGSEEIMADFAVRQALRKVGPVPARL